MVQLFFDTTTNTIEQKVMVISGMAGCGKTQLAIRFMREFEERFKYAYFINGRSKETIEGDLINYVQEMSHTHSRVTFDDALAFFRDPSHRDWLLIYDGVDDIDLELSSLLPDCTHGSIIITTRNPSLGRSTSSSALHLELGAMTEEEAKELVRLSTRSFVDKRDAVAIAQELGYLPVALAQASKYIVQAACSGGQFLERLREYRRKTISIPSGDRPN